jgi:hypothetical protein
MTSPGDDDLPNDDEAPQEPVGSGARQLFGTRGGAKPWGDPVPDAPAKPMAPQPAATPTPTPTPATATVPTASAPYPKVASYTPLPDPVVEEDEGELTMLHPNYKLLMRIGAMILALVLLAGAAVAEGALRTEIGLPLGVVLIPALLAALYLAFPWPSQRFRARGYQMSPDRLRVVRGVWFHSDTVVPFGRVQHIDVDQGPVERAFGIATLTVHTAGSHNASVSLQGLGHERAVEMREAIRARIKCESM